MAITTDDTLANDLRASLRQREGIPVLQTWAEFKAAMTLLGVRDDDRIAAIEYGISVLGQGRIIREDEAEGIVIRESRR